MTYNPSEASRSIIVERAPTTLQIQAIPAPITAGIPFTVAGKLVTDGVGVPGKPINIYVDSGLSANPVTDAAGSFSAQVTISYPGTYVITVSFAGDDFYLPTSVTSPPIDVIPAVVDTFLAIVAPGTVQPNVSFMVNGALIRVDTGEGIPHMTVALFYDGVAVGTDTTDSAGNYMFSMSLPTPGTYTLKAVFAGYGPYGSVVETRVIGVSVEIPEINLAMAGGIILAVADAALIIYALATQLQKPP